MRTYLPHIFLFLFSILSIGATMTSEALAAETCDQTGHHSSIL